MLIGYALLLVMPIISLVVLGISGIFFLYFWAGVIVSCYNSRKLGSHEFTERMIHKSSAPPFPGYANEYFVIEDQSTLTYFQTNNKMELYLKLKS